MSERLARIKEGAKRNGRKIGTLAAIGGLSLLASACGTETHTVNEARQTAEAKYRQAWDHATPAGKFVLQYLRVSYADVVKERDDDSSHNIDSVYQFAFNDGCLGGSSYDIIGGEFSADASAGGFLSSASVHVQGKIPAAAAYPYVSPSNPDVLKIKSGHDNAPVLVFSGLGTNSPLVPVTTQTKSELETWGCDEGGVTHAVVSQDGFSHDLAQPTLFIK